jgi:hypothetical protein
MVTLRDGGYRLDVPADSLDTEVLTALIRAGVEGARGQTLRTSRGQPLRTSRRPRRSGLRVGRRRLAEQRA